MLLASNAAKRSTAGLEFQLIMRVIFSSCLFASCLQTDKLLITAVFLFFTFFFFSLSFFCQRARMQPISSRLPKLRRWEEKKGPSGAEFFFLPHLIWSGWRGGSGGAIPPAHTHTYTHIHARAHTHWQLCVGVAQRGDAGLKRRKCGSGIRTR